MHTSDYMHPLHVSFQVFSGGDVGGRRGSRTRHSATNFVTVYVSYFETMA